jgi:hypothetical protein
MSLTECQAWAAQKGGVCLSDVFVSDRTPMLWRCAQGHEWTAEFSRLTVHFSWCRTCATCGSSVGECISKAAMEHIFDGHLFEKERPDWLLNPEGKRLELDGVNHDLKVAYEFDGIQHQKPTRFEGQTIEEAEAAFRKQVLHDAIKDATCRDHGYTLIRIPHTVAFTAIYDYILAACTARGLPITPAAHPFDATKVDTGKHAFLKHWQEEAIAKGGRLLDTAYYNPKTPMTWMCAKNHTFQMTTNMVQRGQWCRQCSYTVRRITLEDLKYAASLFEGKCLETEFTSNNKTQVRWMCKVGHEFSSTPRVIRSGAWCPTCAQALKHSRGPEAEQRRVLKAERIAKMKELRSDVRSELEVNKRVRIAS